MQFGLKLIVRGRLHHIDSALRHLCRAQGDDVPGIRRPEYRCFLGRGIGCFVPHADQAGSRNIAMIAVIGGSIVAELSLLAGLRMAQPKIVIAHEWGPLAVR